MAKILTLHGPNLNLLGSREPETYGRTTLEQINQQLVQQALDMGHEMITFQSNAEHALIDCIHAARAQAVDFILINPGPLTHTSIALRDALLGVAIPFIELHLSNTQARESFRRTSYFSDVAVGSISGFGPQSYFLALSAAHHALLNLTIDA